MSSIGTTALPFFPGGTDILSKFLVLGYGNKGWSYHHPPVKRRSFTYWLVILRCFACCDTWFSPLRFCCESAKKMCFPADFGRPEAWMWPWKDKLRWCARHRWSSASAIAAEMSFPVQHSGEVWEGCLVLVPGNELSTAGKSIIWFGTDFPQRNAISWTYVWLSLGLYYCHSLPSTSRIISLLPKCVVLLESDNTHQVRFELLQPTYQ